jgi:hypothetical protein
VASARAALKALAKAEARADQVHAAISQRRVNQARLLEPPIPKVPGVCFYEIESPGPSRPPVDGAPGVHVGGGSGGPVQVHSPDEVVRNYDLAWEAAVEALSRLDEARDDPESPVDVVLRMPPHRSW